MGEMNVETDSEYVNPIKNTKVKEFSLQEHLNKVQLQEIHKLFQSFPRKDLKKSLFRSKIINRYKIDLSEKNFELLLSKLDFNKNDTITWEAFITYLILELECKEKEAFQSIIDSVIIDQPQFINSGHRSSLIHITYSASVRRNGTIDYDDGKYLSMSKDGQLNVWSYDLKLLRTYRDNTIYSSIRNTMVTFFEFLPDLNMIVTSSTELELRFYDLTSKNFKRVLALESLPYCINHMFYHFTENMKDESMLICGDFGGNLLIFQFPKKDKGPFRMKIGMQTLVLKWEDILKGKLPLMKAYSILKVHFDWVKQVAYYKLLGSIVSCSASTTAMVVTDIHGPRNSYRFYLKRGIETFCPCEEIPMIATGSVDCVIRLWNPFITTKPISLMRGHHASIVKIFFENKGQRMFSLDRARVIRVWGIISQTCLQIYTGFTGDAGSRFEITTFYNKWNHLFVVGGIKIASVTCGKLIDEMMTDGETQPGEVTVVLYNKLYKLIITCGTDSNIVIWDLRKNRVKGSIRKAHSYSNMGVLVALPITAATFDIPHNFLLTGSINGTIKMWDFNFGICLRNMEIGKNVEVTRLIWIKNRILAVGWNRRVVEFSDTLTGDVFRGKEWELRHTSDILAADCMEITGKFGNCLATGAYNGDLILWRLETGQSYKKYNATCPTSLLMLEFIKEKAEKKSVMSETSKTSHRKKDLHQTVKYFSNVGTCSKKLKVPVRNLLAPRVKRSVERNLAVLCVVFLKKREVLPDQATLLTATENGMIQAWSHHPGGSFLESFKAVHLLIDYVITMATDDDNEFLFTGTFCGYIKIWLMKNYCLSASVPPVHICMPRYRLQFPFLIRDSIITRAKAANKNQTKPLLLSSYKGHKASIFSLTYIPESKILLTGSSDKSARLWTLSGRYIGTLGQKKPWLHIDPEEDPEKTNLSADFRIPPDLARSSSYTTLKVLRGAPPLSENMKAEKLDLSVPEEEITVGTYGKKLTSPYLGHHHSFPKKTRGENKIIPFHVKIKQFPVFVNLRLSQWKPVSRPSTPEYVEDIKYKQDLKSVSKRSVYSKKSKQPVSGVSLNDYILSMI